MTLTKPFLHSLDSKIGDDLVIYDVAGRKVFFIHHHEKGFRFKQIRGKRKALMRIRPRDKLIRINTDGTMEINNLTGFIIAEG